MLDDKDQLSVQLYSYRRTLDDAGQQ